MAEANKSVVAQLKGMSTLMLIAKLAAGVGAIVSIIAAAFSVHAYFLTKAEYNRFRCLNNIEIEEIRNDTLMLQLNKDKTEYVQERNRLRRVEAPTAIQEEKLEKLNDAIALTNILIEDAIKAELEREADRKACETGKEGEGE